MRNQEDLDRLFSALDVVYFHGELRERGIRPAWRRYRRKTEVIYGHYYEHQKKITVSSLLAMPEVPGYVLMGTLYHEMLHVLLGPDHDGGFYAAETRFVHFAAAQVWESEHHAWLLAKQQAP